MVSTGKPHLGGYTQLSDIEVVKNDPPKIKSRTNSTEKFTINILKSKEVSDSEPTLAEEHEENDEDEEGKARKNEINNDESEWYQGFYHKIKRKIHRKLNFDQDLKILNNDLLQEVMKRSMILYFLKKKKWP